MLQSWLTLCEDGAFDTRVTQPGKIPTHIGWPYEDTTYVALEDSVASANDPESVTTLMCSSDISEMLIFHKDVGLKKGDSVKTNLEGLVFIQPKEQNLADK